MRKVHIFIAALLLVVMTLPISAEIIVFKSGEEIEAEVTKQTKSSVKYKTKEGKKKTAKMRDIEEIREGEASWVEFDRRLEELGDDDSAGRLELAKFARDNELTERLEDALKDIFNADPDNAEAREIGGYVKDDSGKWMTQAELEHKKLMEKVAKMPNLKSGNNPMSIAGQQVVIVPPKGYSKMKSYPCCFIFHGNGDSAANFLNWFVGQPDPGFILVAFEQHQEKGPMTAVLPVLDEYVNYDKSRLYALGMSGGAGTALFAPFWFPGQFAAAAFGAGGMGGGRDIAGAIKDAPEKNAPAFYAWAGKGDPNHLGITKGNVEVLKEKGYKCEFIEFGGGHTDKPAGLIKNVFNYFKQFKIED